MKLLLNFPRTIPAAYIYRIPQSRHFQKQLHLLHRDLRHEPFQYSLQAGEVAQEAILWMSARIRLC